MDRNPAFVDTDAGNLKVALRKESVDRNDELNKAPDQSSGVALRKESVDRNDFGSRMQTGAPCVALRKESVDRNAVVVVNGIAVKSSLSARRAWIEILKNLFSQAVVMSLSARRAWIEINAGALPYDEEKVALRKESVDRNPDTSTSCLEMTGRSPQGERG